MAMLTDSNRTETARKVVGMSAVKKWVATTFLALSARKVTK